MYIITPDEYNEPFLSLVQRAGQIDIFDFEPIDLGLHTAEDDGRQTDRRGHIGVCGTRVVVPADVFRRVLLIEFLRVNDPRELDSTAFAHVVHNYITNVSVGG